MGFLGIGGSDDNTGYKGTAMDNPALRQANLDIQALKNPAISKAAMDLQSGKISLNEALQILSGGPNQNLNIGALSSGPISGNLVAQLQTMQGPQTSAMFGDKGLLSQSIGSAEDLMKRGYSLQPEDYEAYGQAQGNIGRMFGAQEQNLSNALAMRGLGASSSAPGAAQFSGLYGNKAEQLGQMQQQIAQQRMQTNMQRLGQMQNFIQGAQGLAQQSTQNNLAGNMGGVQSERNYQLGTAGAATSAYGAQAQDAQAANASQNANRPKGLGDFLQAGIGQGVQGGISGGISGAISGFNPSSLFRSAGPTGGGYLGGPTAPGSKTGIGSL